MIWLMMSAVCETKRLCFLVCVCERVSHMLATDRKNRRTDKSVHVITGVSMTRNVAAGKLQLKGSDE